MAYRVTNRSRQKILGEQVSLARGFKDRFVGLMGRKDLPMWHGLHILPCNSIHTFFMRIAIDVAFLDRDLKVLRIYSALPPWRATPVYFKARSVLELPAGVLAASGTVEGDELAIEDLQAPVLVS